MTQGSKYSDQRKTKTPPHVPLKFVRLAAGMTIDDVITRMKTKTGREYKKGTISAIESGLRGASVEILEALEFAYGLPSGTVTTSYEPRPQRNKAVA